MPNSNLSDKSGNEIILPPSLETDVNPALVYIASLASVRSRRVQRQALDTIALLMTEGAVSAIDFPWHRLRYQHVAAIRAMLIEQYQPATINRLLSALRRTLKEAWRLGHLSAEEYQRAVDISNVRSETLPAGRALTPNEIASLIATCSSDPSPAGIRDRAMISLLYGSGLRREEIAKLRLDDYTSDLRQLVIRGKGRKERSTYIQHVTGKALNEWLMVRGNRPGPLFCPVNKGGKVNAEVGMTAQAVYNMIKKRASGAGVKDFSPHDLRRTFVSDLLDAGADIATVAKMAGHANIQTTARYDRRSEEGKRKAADLLSIPDDDGKIPPTR